MSNSSDEPAKHFFNTLGGVYVVSVLSAFNAEIVTFPFDLVKTRLQIQGEKAGELGTATPYEGMTKTGLGIIRNEGLFKLWNGIEAVFLRQVIYAGVRVTSYLQIKSFVKSYTSQGNEFSIWQAILAGATAGGFAQWVANPADLLKVQMQMEGKRRLIGLPPRVTGLWDAASKIYKSGGIIALWKGSVPSVQRAAFVAIGDLTIYDVTKRFLLTHTNIGDNFLNQCISSFAAGFGAAVMGTPFDVMRTRIMNQPFDERGRGMLYKGSIDCFRQTVGKEGFGALYKGFIPVWIRLGPWAIVFWLTYERILILGGAESF